MTEALTVAPTILVADDEPDIVLLGCRRLRRAGYAVITATNGEEALREAIDRQPDLALLDVMMPRLTGIEAARAIRAAFAPRHLPVILMSAGLPDKVRVPWDADAFVTKPFVGQVLAETVRELLDHDANANAVALA